MNASADPFEIGTQTIVPVTCWPTRGAASFGLESSSLQNCVPPLSSLRHSEEPSSFTSVTVPVTSRSRRIAPREWVNHAVARAPKRKAVTPSAASEARVHAGAHRPSLGACGLAVEPTVEGYRIRARVTARCVRRTMQLLSADGRPKRIALCRAVPRPTRLRRVDRTPRSIVVGTDGGRDADAEFRAVGHRCLAADRSG